MAGPLHGARIIEFAGLGPGPFCGMMLADHGAEVIRIERPGARLHPGDCLARSRASVVLDMKKPDAVQVARDLCRTADGLIEGYRPGVMERLGLGPELLLQDNPKLVYGRMTGWGQHGPLAQAAGHDINYIAIAGVLHTIGERGAKPTPPVNYIGDFGGGGMMLAFGMVSALLHVSRGGAGQVIDCAMTDGAALIAAMTWSQYNAGVWNDQRGVNRLDGGAPFYDAYECADGEYVALGSIEPQFYQLLREKAGLADPAFDDQMNKANWPALKEKVAAAATRAKGRRQCRFRARRTWLYGRENRGITGIGRIRRLKHTPLGKYVAGLASLGNLVFHRGAKGVSTLCRSPRTSPPSSPGALRVWAGPRQRRCEKPAPRWRSLI
jgi:alpha-methylacyl-CoA racemase